MIVPILAALPKLDWALTGSTGMVLQGMDIIIHDIDIQTTSIDAYKIEKRLVTVAERLMPVDYRKSERIASHFGRLRLGQVEIEIMGDIEDFIPGKGWKGPANFAEIVEWVTWETNRVPVISLTHERDAYLEIGRVDKSNAIQTYLAGREA
jgi:hypothetical protein